MHKAMVLVLTQDNNAAKAAAGGQSSNGGKWGCSTSSQPVRYHRQCMGITPAPLCGLYVVVEELSSQSSQIWIFRSKCRVHGIRYVRTGPLQEPVGALLQRLPGHHLRGGLQWPAEDGGGEGRARHVAAGNYWLRQTNWKYDRLTGWLTDNFSLAAPWHSGPETSDTILRQQDGPEGRHVQCQSFPDSRPGEIAGQTLAYLCQQCKHWRGTTGRSQSQSL